MSQPQFDPVKGKAAFESLLPRYKTMSVDSLVMVNADIGLAAVAALGVATRANEPDLLKRFKSLPLAEFDASLVEQLSTMAWACWHAATEHQKVRALATDAKLPMDLVQNAIAMESRMQACCEYYLNDDPVVGPYLAMLRGGSGHRDLAADLLGYAESARGRLSTTAGGLKKCLRPTRPHPPAPSPNSASLRGEGEPEKKLFPAPPSPRAAQPRSWRGGWG